MIKILHVQPLVVGSEYWRILKLGVESGKRQGISYLPLQGLEL